MKPTPAVRRVVSAMDSIECLLYMNIRFKASTGEGRRRSHETYDDFSV